MKIASLILLIVGCVQVYLVAYASVASVAPQPSSGSSATSDSGSTHSSQPEHETISSRKMDQKEAIAPHEHADRRPVSGKTHEYRLPSPSKSNRSKQVRQKRDNARPAVVTTMLQQVVAKPIGAASTSKVVKARTLPARQATTGVAISGQEFRSGRNGSGSPAVIGGPATTRKNAVAINGTEVSRRHLN